MVNYIQNHLIVVFIIVLIIIAIMSMTEALASASPPNKKKIIVTGAGGQTGQALFRKLLASHDFEPFGLVRSEESKQALVGGGGADGADEVGIIPEDHVLVADVTNPQAVQAAVDQVGDDLAGFCICTSAKPKPSDEINPETGRPIFTYPMGDPEQIDWLGQNLKLMPVRRDVMLYFVRRWVERIRIILSNSLGRTTNSDGTTSGGMIVQWKRKAEVYLMTQQQNNYVKYYTIVHPGGLINEPGGERELIVGIDDNTDGTESWSVIPREDVAQVMMEALRYPQYYAGRSFDIRAKSVGDGTPTTNFANLLDPLSGSNCDYNLGATM